jgi:hypothetical protein
LREEPASSDGRQNRIQELDEKEQESEDLIDNLHGHKVPYLFNDDGFDVAIHIVFADRKALDEYQVSDTHVRHFIRESNPNWKTIRVFDTQE